MPERNKGFTVKITETAWEMLLGHMRFLANVSVPAANRLIDTFVEMTADLAVMPERNPWLYHEALPFQKYRKLLFENRYMALYQIRGDIVYINALVDCRQDYVWLL
ncbi:MAG: type II toxin-antitoxin system RelE/ParE family toxin [Syntrophomonas sp.]|uniref:type II toxin-antitoxin system RelE/ParE family toxin n=1 Tax=Syntrophomonas sp. TaxID=2053627 RepID=UPI00261CEC2C|nr:type II toxin-antitoxin system RelE/ParE family toxin [Syntrophomonas sp.]MDD2510683.1 type II toxin-antitoxin system RelE/ParE family toxin [Syntrophomonas sp.]MDD3878701.1 type II toxin-antitoxin system RelE/ParE family toxin [Syntrophomonas sp.]MDD4626163.1 type II toxin-antitoxin system RelE/ParE family toxin [Syntrophomonas sp.]